MSSFNNMCQQQQRRWRIASRIVLFFSSFSIWIILLAFPSRWTKIAAVKSLQVLLPLSSSRQIIGASAAKSKSKSNTFRLDAVTFSTTIEPEITTRHNNETTSGVTASSSNFPSLPSSFPTATTAAAAALDTSIALPEMYEEEIRQYLQASSSSSSSASSLDQFHIHGWRWHTKSLVRDAGRLHQLALRTMSNSDGGVTNNNNNAKRLKDASDYVIGFNLVGLHKIETTFFFPWMRDKLTTITTSSSSSSSTPNRSRQRELSSAFSYVMDKLENDRRTVDHLGIIISRNAHIVASSSNSNNHNRVNAIQEIMDRSAQLQSVAQRMMETEEQLLVPAVALLVPEREQKSFNQKVLLKLGLLDSRLHLVGMYEAINNNDQEKEKELFQKAIPSLSRKMIPRWKRKLYEPKTYMLE